MMKKVHISTAPIALNSEELDLLLAFCNGYFPDKNYPLASAVMSDILDKLTEARKTLPESQNVWSFDDQRGNKK
jgi:hypothetical protein